MDDEDGLEVADDGKADKKRKQKEEEERERAKSYYFSDPFNTFDFVIVMISLLEQVGGTLIEGASVFRVFRIFRLLRIAKTLRVFQRLWLLVSGLVDVFITLVWVQLVLVVILYTAGLMMTIVVGHDDDTPYDFSTSTIKVDPFYTDPADLPHFWDKEDYFGSVFRSTFTMFQVCTLDRWSTNILRPLMNESGVNVLVFFVVIAISRYGLINVAIATIVESTSRNVRKQMASVNDMVYNSEMKVFAQIEKHFRNLADEDGFVSRDAVEQNLKKSSLWTKMNLVNMNPDDVKDLFEACAMVEVHKDVADADRLAKGLIELKGDARSMAVMKLGKQTQGITTIAVRCLDSASRQSTLIQDINHRIDFLTDCFITEPVPDIPPNMRDQVKKNMGIAKDFIETLFLHDEKKGPDKLEIWLRRAKNPTLHDDFVLLRQRRAGCAHVQNFLQQNGELEGWLREHHVKLSTLTQLESWLQQAKAYMREQPGSPSHSPSKSPTRGRRTGDRRNGRN